MDSGLVHPAAAARPDAAPGVRVIASPHPLTTEKTDFTVPSGLTVAEILEQVQADKILLRHAHVYIGPHYVDRAFWRRVRPNPGTTMQVRVVPQGGSGGGKNVLTVVLTIAVLATAIVAPQIAFSAAFLATTGGAFASAGLTAAISIVGGLLITALVPPTSQNYGRLRGTDQQDSPTLSISGARNRPTPYGVVPRLLGEHKQVPPLGANTYTEIRGDDQYLRVLASWGRGPLSFDPLKIGQTLLTEFEDVKVETRRGFHPDMITDRGNWDASSGVYPAPVVFGDKYTVSVAGSVGAVSYEVGDVAIYQGVDGDGWDKNGDRPLTLYSNDVFEDVLNIELTQASGRQVRTSQAGADELSVDITLFQGLVRFDDRGKRQTRSVQVLIEYTPTGEGNWTEAGIITVSAKQTSAIRRNLIWTPAPELQNATKQYDVGYTRLTADTDDSQIFDKTNATALRSIRSVYPIIQEDEAVTALEIRATGQLNGVVDELNAVTRSIVKDWDSVGQTWIYRPSSNPASLYRSVLQDAANARPRTDAQIDLPVLEDWHEKNVAQGFTFNQIIDYRTTVLEVLGNIASAGRAGRQLRDGKWSVVIDEAGKPVSGQITPRNSANFLGKLVFPETPHAFRCPFINAQADWMNDERIVYDDGYDENNATEFEELQQIGITNPDLIWRHARFQLAQARLRPEEFKVTQDIEQIIFTRGDRVALGHDVMTIGLAYPRIKALTLDSAGSNVVAITVDDVCTMELGKSYGLMVRTLEDSSLSVPVATVEGDQVTLTCVPPVPTSQNLAEGQICSFGVLGLETLDIMLTSVEPGRDLSARLSAQAYAPAVHQADQGPIPPFVSGTTPQESILYPVAESVRSGGAVLIRDPDGSFTPRILVTFLRVSSLLRGIAYIECRYRETGGDGPWLEVPAVPVDQGELSIMPVEAGTQYDYQFRWRLSDGDAGNWSPVAATVALGKEAPPANVTGFIVQQNGGAITARWTQIPDLDRDGYTLKYGSPGIAWESMFDLSEVARGTLIDTLDIPPGLWDVAIKAVDTSENESETEARATVQVVSVFDEIDSVAQGPVWAGIWPNAVQKEFTADEAADWNQGTLTNLTIAGDGFLEITL